MTTTYPKFAGKWKVHPKKLVAKAATAVVTGVPLPDRDPKPMTGKFEKGFAPKIASGTYTGTEMIGIGVAHKSGLQPVFSQEQAEDLAKMRRG